MDKNRLEFNNSTQKENFIQENTQNNESLGPETIFIPISLSIDEKEISNNNSTFETDPFQNDLVTNDKDTRKLKPERTGWQRYIGILLALCSCITFSLCILIVKVLNGKIHPGSIGVYRFLGILLTLPVLLYYRYIKKVNVFETIWPLTSKHKGNTKNLLLLLFRGISGCTAILLQYSALSYISIATSTTISFSTPIFVGLVAWIFLGEKCGIVPTLAALITFFGVVITAGIVPGNTGDISLNNDNLIGASLSFGSMVFGTFIIVILRSLRRIHFTLVASFFGVVGLIECCIYCLAIGRFDIPDSTWEWFLITSIGILTFFSQILMTAALKFEDAGPIALVRTSDVVFAFVWQYIFLGVIPDVYSSTGAVIVCSGVALIAFRKYVTNLPPKHRNRQKYSFLLK